MVSPEYKNAANDGTCLREKLPPLHVLFPWKPRTGDLDKAEVKFIDKFKLAIKPAAAVPRILSTAELRQLYIGTSVPEHRYLAPALTRAASSRAVAPHPAKWIPGLSEADLSIVVKAWLNTNRSTEYEKLSCIGLDPESGQLTAVLNLKQGRGYSGGPETAGSREYVAFWMDRGLGFEYRGTASVGVHDFGCLPQAGLEYAVSLPADLLTQLRTRGEGASTVKVRAVLSWNTPPSTSDPYAPVVWGDVVQCHIPIPLRRIGRSFAIGTREIEEGDRTFILYLSDRSNANHEDRAASTGFPQADGVRYSRRAPSAATEERGGSE